MKRVAAVFLCGILLLSLAGCKPGIDQDFKPRDGSDDFVSGSSRSDVALPLGAICIGEDGIFFVSLSKLLCFYDFNKDRSYAICSKPNCTHASLESCVAAVHQHAAGFAVLDGFGYYLQPCEDYNSWELIQIDIQNQTKKVLATIGGSDWQEEGWTVPGVLSAAYGAGKAWIKIMVQYMPENEESVIGADGGGQQLIAVDLSDGSITEITKRFQRGEGFLDCTFDCFSPELVFCSYTEFQEPRMTFPEYAASVGKEAAASKSEEYDALLEEYYSYQAGFYENAKQVRTILSVSTDTMEQRVLCRGTEEELPFLWCIYAWNGQAVVTDREKYTLVDGITGEEISAPPELQNTNSVAWYGDAEGRLYNGDCLLTVRFKGENNEKCDISKYSLTTGKETFLFEDDGCITFRICGQTSDKLVGNFATRKNTETEFAWIYKTDYEAGNFSAAHKFSLN